MSQQSISYGAFDNDSSADKIRIGFKKTDENFDDLYTQIGSLGSMKVYDQPISMVGVTASDPEVIRVADAINLRDPGFTVPLGELAVVSHYIPYYPNDISPYFYKHFYLIKTGAGNYGLSVSSPITVDGGDIVKLGTLVNEPTTSIDLGDIGSSTVQASINTQSPSVTKLGFTTVSCIISSVQKVYIFDATDGDYGTADGSTSADNFIDVNGEPDLTPKVPDGSADLYVYASDQTASKKDLNRTNEFSQNNATLTLPFDVDDSFEQGTSFYVYFSGTGTHTIVVPTLAATSENRLFEQYDLIFVQKRSNSTDKWIVKKLQDTATGTTATPYGSQYMEDNATTTTLTVQSTWYKILGTTTALSNSTDIDNSTTSNKLVYSGALDRHFNLIASIAFTTDTNNQIIEFSWHKNGATRLNPKIARKVGTGTDVGALACTTDETLSTSDYVELWARNITSAGVVLTVQDLHLLIAGTLA